jgi:TatD DNase family protein
MTGTPMWIDTHAHLDDDRFAKDFEAVLARAEEAGVGRIVAVATDLASTTACLALAGRHSRQLRPSVGIHPNHAAAATPSDWDEVVRHSATPGVVALGETGLDRYRRHTPFPMQEDYFARHLELARLRKLPVIIHTRDADADVERMLRDDYEKHGPIRGVLHSFCGSPQTATTCLAMGLYVSFAGMITYKTADDVRATSDVVPGDRILVETDCPYLAPVPKRGSRNEPAFVVHTAACLAQRRGISLEAFAEQTTRNAMELFPGLA